MGVGNMTYFRSCLFHRKMHVRINFLPKDNRGSKLKKITLYVYIGLRGWGGEEGCN